MVHRGILVAVAVASEPQASDLLHFSTWRHVVHGAALGLGQGVMFFAIVYSLERLYKARTSQYRTRNFVHDAMYWVYGRSQLSRILFTAWLFQFLASHFAFVQVRALQSLPVTARFVVHLILADFLVYWIHRWQHSSRFLWAFHAMHHSQEQLSFATVMRTHPIDDFLLTTLTFVPLLMLGDPIHMVLPVYLGMEFIIAILHSEIPWKFGPLYRVFVSPTFHSIHHSLSREHHDRNYGRLLSIWDHLFGTASADRSRPQLYGLADCKMPTLASQLLSPFGNAFRLLVSSPRRPGAGEELARTDSI
jgi:sterol desaturase/sphingolipid hydroxylase (fatty acid hydroxylase superfamily)